VSIEINKYNTNEISPELSSSTVEFLHNSLDEFKDSKEAIGACLDYASDANRGGWLYHALDEGQIVGAVVLNKTHMKGYVPENFLVYIAVDSKMRGKGVGKLLMKQVIDDLNANISLHVEPHNPAKFLYEKLGFTNKYLEMRYTP